MGRALKFSLVSRIRCSWRSQLQAFIVVQLFYCVLRIGCHRWDYITRKGSVDWREQVWDMPVEGGGEPGSLSLSLSSTSSLSLYSLVLCCVLLQHTRSGLGGGESSPRTSPCDCDSGVKWSVSSVRNIAAVYPTSVLTNIRVPTWVHHQVTLVPTVVVSSDLLSFLHSTLFTSK